MIGAEFVSAPSVTEDFSTSLQDLLEGVNALLGAVDDLPDERIAFGALRDPPAPVEEGFCGFFCWPPPPCCRPLSC